MHYNHTLQSEYLFPLIKKKASVHLYLKDGRKLKGIVFGITNESILFKGLTMEAFNKRRIHAIFPVIQQHI
jgi:sRNA-binding regulator protein Hfq